MPAGRTLSRLRSSLLTSAHADRSDGQLLRRFLEGGDAEAFETLLHRHSPMVMRVCARVLRHGHDAEDAFQATFLVLMRKAATVSPPDALANWLYGVAQMTAVRLRASNARRSARERLQPQTPERPVMD